MTRKAAFFEGWSWFKFNNLGLELGKNLKFYTTVVKRSKLKVKKFLWLISTFTEKAEEKLVGRGGLLIYILRYKKLTFSSLQIIISYTIVVMPCRLLFKIWFNDVKNLLNWLKFKSKKTNPEKFQFLILSKGRRRKDVKCSKRVCWWNYCDES